MATEEPQEEKPGDGSSPGEDAGGGKEKRSKDSAEERKGAGVGGKEGRGKSKRGRKPKGAPGKEEEREKKGGKRRASVLAKPPAVERPTRERKTVERFSVAAPQRAAAAVSIQQGSGTMLKDIPNVFFKLSKRRVDENIKLLHTILFAKKAKAHYLKRNIYQFSGFVWTENEEKPRAKVKEKLDKCVKEKLLDFCDLLDIPVSKATMKKEEISAKLLEFLESPHVTRDTVLAEKEQKGRKRKRRTKEVGEATSGDADPVGEPKKRKKSSESSAVKKRQKHSAKRITENEEEDGSADDIDENQEGAAEGSEESSETEDEGAEKEPVADKKVSNQRLESKAPKSRVNVGTTVKRGRPAKSAKSSSGSPSKKSPPEGKGRAPGKSSKGTSMVQSKRASKVPTKQKAEPTKRGSVKLDKSASDSKKVGKEGQSDSGPNDASKSRRDKGKGKNDEELAKVKRKKKSQPASTVYAKKQGTASGKAEPTREDLQAAVRDILKEVDFNTATLADILRQLGSQFGTDLMHRKSEVKSIIEEVINDMTDDEEDGEDEDGEEDHEDGDE